MQRTRVALAELHGLLRDITRDTLSREPDMDLVPWDVTIADLPHVMSEGQTTVVLVGRELLDEELDAVSAISGITLLALIDDGRGALRYELQPVRVRLDGEGADFSPESLVDAIRAASRRRDF